MVNGDTAACQAVWGMALACPELLNIRLRHLQNFAQLVTELIDAAKNIEAKGIDPSVAKPDAAQANFKKLLWG